MENAGRGSIRANENKQTDNQPDYKGSITINGAKYWLSGWKKKDEETGKPWLSLSATAAEAKPAPARDYVQPKGQGASQEMDDEIPF